MLDTYCTELRGTDNHVYGGPIVRAASRADATGRCRGLGVVLTGALCGCFDADTLQPVRLNGGNLKQNQYAMWCFNGAGSPVGRARARAADALRSLARRLCGWADRVEPMASRRGIVGVRP